MKLIDVLRQECVVAGVQSRNKKDAIREVVQVAKRSLILKDVDEKEILLGLEKREALGSTGFGRGIAIPHCRLKSVSEFVVGIITVPDGIDFDALDGEKVNLIVFIIAPEIESNAHIRLLSAISQTLLSPGAVKEILAQRTPEGLYESFLRYTRADIDTKGQIKHSLLHIFIQKENIFRDILQILTATDSSSLVVLDAHNTGVYLAKIPLFADLWRDQQGKFSKIIVAVIEKGLVNEAIRRIETVTGNLNEHNGVMVTVQEIPYVAGSLSMQI
jgi:mannitol/fructose-specific phosphotransferase system IIA component (Ntr-type)